jgi:hypothetical protein
LKNEEVAEAVAFRPRQLNAILLIVNSCGERKEEGSLRGGEEKEESSGERKSKMVG